MPFAKNGVRSYKGFKNKLAKLMPHIVRYPICFCLFFVAKHD